METNEDQPKRITATFAASTYAALKELADAKGISMADALRDAIALSKWFKDTQDNGTHILLEKNGRMERILKL